MSRVLIAYHSQTGNTRKAAHTLAQRLHADIEPIAPLGPLGPFAYLGRVMRAVAKAQVAPPKPQHDPARYDLVVVAGPIWAGHLSPEVNGYIARHAEFIERHAMLLTCGGARTDRALAQARRAMGRDPVATCAITDEHRASGTAVREIESLGATVEQGLARGDSPPVAADAP